MKKVLAGIVAVCMFVCVFTGCSVEESNIETETETAIAETENLSDEYIVEKFYKAYDFWETWVYGQHYVTDRESHSQNMYYGAVDSDSPIQTKEELKAAFETYFTKSLTEEFMSFLNPEDINGKLYIAYGDVGDNGEVLDNVTVRKVNDNKYELTLDMTQFFEDRKYTKKVYYVFEDGKWVFENDVMGKYFFHWQKHENIEYLPVMKKYYLALSEKWDRGRLWDEDLCYLVGIEKHDNAMKEIGYCFMDVNADNQKELLIGEIENGYWGQVIYDLYTLKDGKVHKILFSHERNRYLLFEENGKFKIANEGTESAAKSFTNYYAFNGSDLKLEKAIILDGTKTPESEEFTGFFVAYDDDFNTDNDTAIDKKTATEIMESYSAKYITPEFIPFETLG